METDNSF